MDSRLGGRLKTTRKKTRTKINHCTHGANTVLLILPLGMQLRSSCWGLLPGGSLEEADKKERQPMPTVCSLHHEIKLIPLAGVGSSRLKCLSSRVASAARDLGSKFKTKIPRCAQSPAIASSFALPRDDNS